MILIPPINLAENYSIEFMYFALTIPIAINGIYAVIGIIAECSKELSLVSSYYVIYSSMQTNGLRPFTNLLLPASRTSTRLTNVSLEAHLSTLLFDLCKEKRCDPKNCFYVLNCTCCSGPKELFLFF